MKTLLVLTALSLALVACGKEERRSPEPAPTVAPPTAPTAPVPVEVVPPAASMPAAGAAGEVRGGAVDTAAAPSRRSARGARASGAAPAAAAAGSTHTVVRGDTLGRIARARGVSATELAKWNNVRDPRRLRVGQELRLTPP